jgi:hypothetical protein
MCSSSREKQETDSVKWTKNHGFWEQKMPWYRGFIWRTERPNNWKSHCVMMHNCITVYRYCITLVSVKSHFFMFLLIPVTLVCSVVDPDLVGSASRVSDPYTDLYPQTTKKYPIFDYGRAKYKTEHSPGTPENEYQIELPYPSSETNGN